MTGLLIAIEGIDGSGKTTVATRLATTLKGRGREVLLTREPGGTRAGEAIRQLLLEEHESGMVAETEALLFAASRAQLVAEVIRPALDCGAMVITDRFVDSSLAYQSGGRCLDLEGLRRVQWFATDGLEADLKILLDIPVVPALQRRHQEPDGMNRLDREDIAFYERVRDTYLKLAAAEPGRWRVIAAEADPESVWTEVWEAVEGMLTRVRNPGHGNQSATEMHP